MGKHVAQSIRDQVEGRPMKPFHYVDKGSFAVIGRGSAIGVLFDKVRVKGKPAWWMWLGIHIAFLVGFRNRLSVLSQWAYTYLTRKREVRLITGLHGKELPPLAASSEARPELPTGALPPVQSQPSEPTHVH
jgi:NADH dehydrogenase